MQLILAIDGDRRQAEQLASLVRERLLVDLVLAASAGEGLQELGDRVPDLIMTSPLLSPFDEDVLAEYLRDLGPAGAHVQTLRIPVPSAPSSSGRGLFSLRRKIRRETATDSWSVFADEIAAYLARAAEEQTAAAASRAKEEAIQAESATSVTHHDAAIAPEFAEPYGYETAPEQYVYEPYQDPVQTVAEPASFVNSEAIELGGSTAPPEPAEQGIYSAAIELGDGTAPLESAEDHIHSAASELGDPTAPPEPAEDDIYSAAIDLDDVTAPPEPAENRVDASKIEQVEHANLDAVQAKGQPLPEPAESFPASPSMAAPPPSDESLTHEPDVASLGTEVGTETVVAPEPRKVPAAAPRTPAFEAALAAIRSAWRQKDRPAPPVDAPTTPVQTEKPVDDLSTNEASTSATSESPDDREGQEVDLTGDISALEIADADASPPLGTSALPEPPVSLPEPEPPVQDVAPERGAPANGTNKARKPREKKRAGKPAAEEPRAVQDEWGLFDPNQCGFAAVVEKLDEVADAPKPNRTTTVRVISYR